MVIDIVNSFVDYLVQKMFTKMEEPVCEPCPWQTVDCGGSFTVGAVGVGVMLCIS